MSAGHEVLILCDRNLGSSWHITPEVHDVIGWWPDGGPAWVDHIELPDSNAIVLDVIPKRQPIDDDWVEDDPRVLRLIDFAITLNDIHRLASGRVLRGNPPPADAAEVAESVLERVRASFRGDDVGQLLQLAMRIESGRTVNI